MKRREPDPWLDAVLLAVLFALCETCAAVVWLLAAPFRFGVWMIEVVGRVMR